MSGYIGLEETWFMRSRCIKAAHSQAGNHFCCRPVGADKIESRIFVTARARQFAVWDFRLIIVIGHIETDLVPVIKSLGSCDRNRRLCSSAPGDLRIFEEDFVRAAYGIRHRAMTKRRDDRKKNTAEEGYKFFHNRGIVKQSAHLESIPPRLDESGGILDESGRYGLIPR